MILSTRLWSVPRGLIWVLIATALALSGPAAASTSDGASPETLVDRFDATLLQVMHEAKQQVGYGARFDRLAAVMNETFDFEGMSRLAVGPTWNGLTTVQRRSIVAAFRNYSIATYVAEFDDYSGEQLVRDGRLTLPQGLMVMATLVPKDDQPVKFGYLFHKRDGNWRVIDIYLNGTISQLAVRRSEFAAVLAQSGADGLVDELVQKEKTLEQGAKARS